MKKLTLIILATVASLATSPTIYTDCGFSPDTHPEFEKQLSISYKDLIKARTAANPSIVKYNKKSIAVPDFKKAIKEYRVVANKGSIIAAHEGLSMILNTQVAAGATGLAKKNIKAFATVLTESNCCIGYIYGARAYTKEFNPGYADYNAALNTILRGKESCAPGKYLDKNIAGAYQHTKAKIKTLVKLRKAGRIK